MNSKTKKIFVWMLTWAGLLLAVLYSPIGSPDLYDDKYTLDYQGVNFGTQIENASSVKPAERHSKNEFSTHYNQSSSNVSSLNYKVNTIATPAKTGQNYGALPTTRNNGYSSLGGKANGASGSNLSEGIFPASGNNGSNVNSLPQNPGLGSSLLITDLTQVGSSPRFFSEYQPNSGATDPGEDEVFGEPIPVGDGWVFLLFLSLLYVLWKKNSIRFLNRVPKL